MEDIVTFDEFVLSSVNLKQVHALILQSSVIPCWRHIAVEKNQYKQEISIWGKNTSWTPISFCWSSEAKKKVVPALQQAAVRVSPNVILNQLVYTFDWSTSRSVFPI